MWKFTGDGCAKQSLESGRITRRQQSDERLANDFGIGKARETLRAGTPRLHRAVESEAEHSVFGRRQNCGEQMLGPQLKRHDDLELSEREGVRGYPTAFPGDERVEPTGRG